MSRHRRPVHGRVWAAKHLVYAALPFALITGGIVGTTVGGAFHSWVLSVCCAIIAGGGVVELVGERYRRSRRYRRNMLRRSVLVEMMPVGVISEPRDLSPQQLQYIWDLGDGPDTGGIPIVTPSTTEYVTIDLVSVK